MSPLRGEEFTGRSVEEAIERGLRSLGKKRTDVEYEVLEKGKPANVLGIRRRGRSRPHHVRRGRRARSGAVIDEAEVPRRPTRYASARNGARSVKRPSARRRRLRWRRISKPASVPTRPARAHGR